MVAEGLKVLYLNAVLQFQLTVTEAHWLVFVVMVRPFHNCASKRHCIHILSVWSVFIITITF